MSSVSIEFYLVAKADIQGSYVKGRPSVRVTKNKPSLEKNEVPVKMRLELPIGLFQRPQITAQIKVPDSEAKPHISASVADNIADIIRQETGLNVTLTVDGGE